MADLNKGRFRRALGLSKLGAQLALKQGKALITRKPAEAHRELAEMLVRELGQMKGLPMKIGQLLSYMEGMVPDEHRDIYRDILGKLRTNAEPLGDAACLAVLEAELGQSVDALFDDFSPAPIAAASIGQVYRARYQGQEICIKVQYPGIAEATESDLKNMNGIFKMMRVVLPNMNTEQMIEDFRVRLIEECNYLQEAKYQSQFSQIYKDDPDICIPEVLEDLCTERVLTTRFIEGKSLDDFCATADQPARDRAGMTLYRLAFGTLLEHGLFHADPHPGNLLFCVGPEQKLGLLDFGCVQPIDELARHELALFLNAAMEESDMAEPAKLAFGINDIDDLTMDVVLDIARLVLAPILEAQPYRFTRTFAANLAKATIDAKMSMSTGFLTRRRRFSVEREGVMFIVRNLFGLASVWGQLESEGDYRALTESIILSDNYLAT